MNEQHTRAYCGYSIKTTHFSNGYWSAALSSRDGSAKAQAKHFHTETEALEWAEMRVDGLVGLGIV